MRRPPRSHDNQTREGALSEFSYIADRIDDAAFEISPFQHLLIENFLSDAHFEALRTDRQIHFEPVASHAELFHRLDGLGYEVQRFPGCVSDRELYLRCIESGDWEGEPEIPTDDGLIEGFGMCFRLARPEAPLVQRLLTYLIGEEFKAAIERKFDVRGSTSIDTGIQKYLTGYEISPHPDIRAKCMTYLLNLNPGPAAETMPIHTHLLQLREERAYVTDLWERNPDMDRKWVPWDWCETAKTTPANNSMVLFKCHDRSLHGVKLAYDHLPFQRTQIYGNLWYNDRKPLLPVGFRDLDRLRPV